MNLDFQHVTFFHDRLGDAVFLDLSLRLHPGWTAVVGPNGAGKTTLLRLAVGELEPTAGTVRSPRAGILCPQRTDEAPPDLSAFLVAEDRAAHELRGRLGTAEDWFDRFSTLSHGERNRAQIAVALWRNPELLAVDEPTNHLDLPSIECLEGALSECPSALLLVSHDRHFLARLTETEWKIEGGKVQTSMRLGSG